MIHAVKHTSLGLLILILFSSSPLFAGKTNSTENNIYNHHTGFYLGGDIGLGLVAGKDKEDNQFLGGLSGVGGKAVLGYQFNHYFGLEADLIGVEGLIISSQALLYGAMIRGTLPLGNRLSLYAKAGIGALSARADDIPFTDTSMHRTVVTALVGAGLAVAVTHHIDLTLDYTGEIANRQGITGLNGLLGIGALYHF